MKNLARAAPGLFPPDLIIQVKALACELPAKKSVPLSRWSLNELTQYVRDTGLIAEISQTTVWRWLHEDAIRPWQHRCWIFPRDPQFSEKAGRILDLYNRIWQDQTLNDNEFVISADEKTSIQARYRKHQTIATLPGKPMKIEHEYTRLGAWAYIAAWDVHRAKLFGRCEASNGIAPFDRLVSQVMNQHPYNQAQRVFWIMDNGSSHRGDSCISRLKSQFKNIEIVHGPIHASWLNQVEIYFSILQRKVLTPNDFPSLQALEERIMAFQNHYEIIAKPFEWKFSRQDLKNLIAKLCQKNNAA